jgi:hypothetical protein
MVAAAAAGGGWLFAQTAINLGVQSRNVDFSAATFTKPVKTGAGLPGTCATGELFFRTDAAPGQNLYGCTGPNTWTLLVNGSGGGGVSAASQLTDFQLVRSSSTVLTINGSCSGANPCNYRFGNKVVRMTAPSTVTLAGSTAPVAVFFYLSASGDLTAGHATGVTLNCSGCTVESGVSSFPAGSIPLHTWIGGSPAGEWASSGIDYRAIISSFELSVGAGLSRVVSPSTGGVTLSVDSASVGLRVSVPSASNSACTQGQWAADSNYVYHCVATNTWRRAALSSW